MNDLQYNNKALLAVQASFVPNSLNPSDGEDRADRSTHKLTLCQVTVPLTLRKSPRVVIFLSTGEERRDEFASPVWKYVANIFLKLAYIIFTKIS
jgi:hypothetical protein